MLSLDNNKSLSVSQYQYGNLFINNRRKTIRMKNVLSNYISWNFAPYFILFLFFFNSCHNDSRQIVPLEVGLKITIFNNTGHLIANSSDECGPGIEAKFVLTSPTETKEYVFGPDTINPALIKLSKGQTLSIRVFEITDNEEILLIQDRVTFDPDEGTGRQPRFILCPKTVLRISGF